MFDPKSLNYIVILPSIEKYKDRVKMFDTVASSFASAKIILSDGNGLENSEICRSVNVPIDIVDGCPGSFAHKRHLLQSILAMDVSKPTIFQDTFVPNFAVLNRLSRSVQV